MSERLKMLMVAIVVTVAFVLVLVLATPYAHAAGAAPRLCGPWHFFGVCYGPPIGGQG